MKKINKVYNGYELENGKMYRLIDVGVNKYEMAEVVNLGLDDYRNYKEIPTGIIFNRVKDYKAYIKSLENGGK